MTKQVVLFDGTKVEAITGNSFNYYDDAKEIERCGVFISKVTFRDNSIVYVFEIENRKNENNIS